MTCWYSILPPHRLGKMSYHWFLRFPDVPFLSERRRRRLQPRVAGPTGESPSLSGHIVGQGRSRTGKASVLTGVCCMWLCQQHTS
ncbi:hypothetical protein HanRHA438_Chr11g0523991 [Helianthus annuus]|nr:hypothetical protein HanRHA438_Chr11g0523991 [Helianthus annuus]